MTNAALAVACHDPREIFDAPPTPQAWAPQRAAVKSEKKSPSVLMDARGFLRFGGKVSLRRLLDEGIGLYGIRCVECNEPLGQRNDARGRLLDRSALLAPL